MSRRVSRVPVRATSNWLTPVRGQRAATGVLRAPCSSSQQLGAHRAAWRQREPVRAGNVDESRFYRPSGPRIRQPSPVLGLPRRAARLPLRETNPGRGVGTPTWHSLEAHGGLTDHPSSRPKRSRRRGGAPRPRGVWSTGARAPRALGSCDGHDSSVRSRPAPPALGSDQATGPVRGPPRRPPLRRGGATGQLFSVS